MGRERKLEEVTESRWSFRATFPDFSGVATLVTHTESNSWAAECQRSYSDEIRSQVSTNRPPRPEQVDVLNDFERYLAAIQSGRVSGRYARIVLPPRTGKTVIAGHILARSQLSAVFVVPTRVLVEQTREELRQVHPDLMIGTFYGEERDLVPGGVNITTYSMLDRLDGNGDHAAAFRDAALVFLDEAHHCMTSERLHRIRRLFSDEAIRIALTATPDYDERRTLCRFFPDLIHEMTVEEALDLGLLAPARVWVAEVDGRGSEVRLLAGDFDEQALGRVMSDAPFLRSAELFRYHPKNAAVPALICCVSRAQAHELVHYLDARRPRTSSPVHLILGDTPRDERERILSAFERGEVDTLVQVGVLIEGWNSPRCKLLVDLAPSLSRVRATQKYFRALTRFGNNEARIYVILPAELPVWPVLPTELFGPHLKDYECGDLIGGDERKGNSVNREPAEPLPIESVRIRQRILIETRFARPQLDRSDLPAIRRVLLSCPEFEPEYPPPIREFLQLFFNHELFVGRGEFLLRWLEIPVNTANYAQLLATVFPRHGGAARLWLSDAGLGDSSESVGATRKYLKRSLRQASPHSKQGRDESFVLGWRAATGGLESRDPTLADREGLAPEAILLRREQLAMATYALRTLTTRNRRVVAMAHGLRGMPALPTELIGFIEGVEVSCARGILSRSLKDFAERFPSGMIESLREGTGKARLQWKLLEPPKLYRVKRHLQPWQYSEHPEDRHFYSTREWTPLANPVTWIDAVPSIVRAMVRLGIASDWLRVPPTAEQVMLDGTEYRELIWRTEKHELCMLAIEGIRNDPGMGEVSVPLLFARLHVEAVVNAKKECAEMCLLGIDGAFQAVSIEEGASRHWARAWGPSDG